MHADWSVCLLVTNEILIHLVGKERHERCHQPVENVETCVERQVSRLLIGPGLAFPEAPSIAAHIPVTELISERFNRAPRPSRIVVFECGCYEIDRPVQQSQHPSINFRAFGIRYISVKTNIIETGIKNEECICIPDGVNERARNFCNNVCGDTFLRFRCKTS